MKAQKLSYPFDFREEPEYVRIVEIIKYRIKNREMKVGDLIQSEYLLSIEFNVSRFTVKSALAILINEGYLLSIPGKGNFVCEKEFAPYAIYFDEMMATGVKYDECRVLSVDIVKSGSVNGNLVNLFQNKSLILIKRVFFRKNRIEACQEKYLPYIRGNPCIEREIEYLDFSKLTKKKNPIYITTKQLRIKAQMASGEISKILQIAEGEPVLVVNQTQFDEKSNPIAWETTYFSEKDSGLKAVTSID